MRVLLFTQAGDARPKVAKQFGVRLAWADLYFAKIKFGEPGQPDRGWLVECASAEAGRQCIANYERRRAGDTSLECLHDEGRILASGGKP